jgi:hypothetical protein
VAHDLVVRVRANGAHYEHRAVELGSDGIWKLRDLSLAVDYYAPRHISVIRWP